MPLSRNTRKVSFSMMLAVGSSGGLKGTQLVLTTYQPYLWRKQEVQPRPATGLPEPEEKSYDCSQDEPGTNIV